MKRLLLLAFTACLSFGSVYSQDPKIMVDAFFVNYKEKGPLMALDKLFQTNTWMMERTKDKVDNVKSQLNSVVTVVGDYHGYESPRTVFGITPQWLYGIKDPNTGIYIYRPENYK